MIEVEEGEDLRDEILLILLEEGDRRGDNVLEIVSKTEDLFLGVVVVVDMVVAVVAEELRSCGD